MYDFFPPTNRLYFFFLALKPAIRYACTGILLMSVGLLWYSCFYTKLETSYAHYQQTYQNQRSLEKMIKLLEKEYHAKRAATSELENKIQQLVSRSANAGDAIFSLLQHAVACDLVISSYTNISSTQLVQEGKSKRALALSCVGSFDNIKKFFSCLDTYFMEIEMVSLKADAENIKMDLRLNVIQLHDV